MKDDIKRIHEYVWARHVDGSDRYDHSITDDEAATVLDDFYSGIGNRNSPDQVYLGILLFERAFEIPDQQAALFERARRIFNFYRKVTGETDWPAVEDRLEDIAMFFQEAEAAAEPEPAPAPVEEETAPAAAPAPPTTATAVAAPPPEPAVAEVSETVSETVGEVVEPAPVVEQEVEQPTEVKPAPVQVTSAAEEEERRAAEQEAARRQATEAFIADLEVVEGMELVPAGAFVFGPESQEIFLDSFYVDKHPVTNRQYQRFVRETGYRQPRYVNNPRLNQPDQPVVGVSLGDAQQFAKWAGKEIPTEAQWEKAARGTDGRPYPWGNDPPGASDACFGLDAREGAPVAVGASLRNVSPFGVLDICGNVWEWTTSRYAKASEYKVVRGGSYNDPPEMLRLDFRLEAHPKDKCEAIGFRCVKNIHG
ncbi:MAG: formylglycine-generating enzyme family protein [Planctomycetota bacterium]|nr:formylglycine-generating enzyme family protein [Planctomycetota bacterium]